jgi:Ca2+-binding RTX toxin-like protein
VALSATPDGTPASCVNVDLAASDTGGSGLQSEQYSLDGGTTYTDLPPGTALRFNVPGSGFMHVVARAIDGAGNLSAQDVRFFIATPCSDTTPPDTFINDGPDNGATITTPTATFAFDSDDSKATFECSLDGSAYFPCSSPATTPALVNGQHTASVRAIDVAGNSDPSPATRTFTVAVPPSGGGGGNGGGGTGGGGGGTGGTGGTPPGPSGPVGGASKVPTTQLPQPGCPIAGTQLIGTARGDRRSGTSLSDIMFGRAGNDRLAGGSGNDCLYGEDGKDRLDGGAGDDRLLGGAGDDTLTDVAGTDRFDGGAGNDKINARDKARAGRKKADTVACGAGKKDVALVDKADRVAKDCEKVKRR